MPSAWRWLGPALLLCTHAATFSLAQELRAIRVGETIEARLGGNAVHAYVMTVEAGQFLHVVVDQGVMDLAVTVFRPDGAKAVLADGAWHGTEPVSLIADVSGHYRVEVRSTLNATVSERYTITLQEARAPVESDRTRMHAEVATTAAKQLVGQESAASFRAAIEKYEEALALWRELDDRDRQGHTHNALGFIFQALGDNDRAMERYRDALSLRTDRNDIRGQAETIGNIAAISSSLGEKRQALEHYARSLSLRRLAGDTRGQGIALNNMGVVAGDLGETERAIGLFEQALPLLESVGDYSSAGATLLNIGAAHGLLGQGQRALDYYARALALLRTGGNRRGESRALMAIGNLHRALEDHRQASDHYSPALRLAEEVGDRRLQAAVVTAMGAASRSLGDHETALRRYGEALEIWQQVGDRRGESYARLELGDLERERGTMAAASEQYDRALTLLQAVGDRRGKAMALHGLALTLAATGDGETAEGRFLQALALAREVRDRNNEPEMLLHLASLYRQQGRLGHARKYLEEALPILESVRAGFLSLEHRAAYLASKRQVYEDYVGVLMDLGTIDPTGGFAAAALEAAERARARSLLELLTEARADIRRGVDSALVDQERRLQQLLNDKAERQGRLLGASPSAAAVKEVESLDAEMRQLLTDYEGVQARIRAASPRYASLTQPRTLTVSEIQRRVLDEDTLLIQYALGKDRSYVWAVSSTALISDELPGRREIESAAREFYDLVSATSASGSPAEDRRRLDRAGARLTRLLLEPLGPALGTKRLLIVADGAVQYVPFAALPAPGAADGRPLIADREIVTAPSASAIAVLRAEAAGRRVPPKLIAVLADPVFAATDPRMATARATRTLRAGSILRRDDTADAARTVPEPVGELAELGRAAADVGAGRGAFYLPRLPFTRQEAQTILDLVPRGQGFQALDFDASVTTATSPALAQYKILHFATHGFINTSHPELSGVVLSLVDAAGRPQRGFLRAHDIYNLQLPAELVVLSACRSALGADVHGEGLLGLTRGFMYAGALRVVASLWKVDDQATAELVKRFYTVLLNEHVTPAAALRQAQVAMWKTRQWSSPRYWAAFIIQGEWR